ncbi:MAG: hypothetical protein WCI02_02545 [Planctomycetota bacterium]
MRRNIDVAAKMLQDSLGRMNNLRRGGLVPVLQGNFRLGLAWGFTQQICWSGNRVFHEIG